MRYLFSNTSYLSRVGAYSQSLSPLFSYLQIVIIKYINIPYIIMYKNR